MLHLSSAAIYERLSKPTIQVPVQMFHSTRIVNKASHGKTSHIFRFQGKSTSSAKTKGGFEFFSLRSVISTPGPYMLYGLGGLIPFMSAPSYMYLTGEFNPTIAQAQLVYGACILSFLGGVSWGNHLNRPEKASLESLSYSILLPLVAWPAVLISPNPTSFLIMTCGIIYAGAKDTGTASYPRWFQNLRFLLSTLVALSLSATLIFRFTLESDRIHETDKHDNSSE
ncbi:transmembrane protein 69 [Elysia marginata]|uniref:Transmembrane protein 69 n=1 Tax=Elysia marginata TaxID=1093978 RepID=A0AAV4JDF5_9GAST|nr:transmembrane protein 69 [Elysia marginata]